MKKNKIISAVAGRSGGHIIPCLTLAKKYTDDKKILDICEHIIFNIKNNFLMTAEWAKNIGDKEKMKKYLLNNIDNYLYNDAKDIWNEYFPDDII